MKNIKKIVRTSGSRILPAELDFQKSNQKWRLLFNIYEVVNVNFEYDKRFIS